jgi:hypothetical protein
MKKVEYLLTCLAEECAEVQQIASKAQRFGLDNHQPERTETNLEELYKEIAHIDSVRILLEREGILIEGSIMPQETTRHIAQIEQYMNVSRECGILEEQEK